MLVIIIPGINHDPATAHTEHFKAYQKKIDGTDITPQKTEKIKPSPELLEIIAKIKNGTMPEYINNTSPTLGYSVTKEDLNIIKSGGTAITAAEIKPSAALKAVLDAYRNGSLDYEKRNIKDVEEELFYHQP